MSTGVSDSATPETAPVAERPVGLVRGTHDWLPAEYAKLAAIERQLLDGFARAGYAADSNTGSRIHRPTRTKKRRGHCFQALRTGGRGFRRDLSAARTDGEYRPGLCRGGGVPAVAVASQQLGPGVSL